MVGFHLGPIFAIAQTVARPSMRALASAIILLTATCFGQGVGPLAVGMINDALKGDYGVDAVRYSLLSAGGDHHAWRAVVRVGGALHPRRHRADDLDSTSVQRPGIFLELCPGFCAIARLPLGVEAGLHQRGVELHRIGLVEDDALGRKLGLQRAIIANRSARCLTAASSKLSLTIPSRSAGKLASTRRLATPR